MTLNKIKIVFFGTPDFAIPSLQAIFETFELLAVVTALDKPAGRGHEIQISEVKKWALHHDILLFQPKNLKSIKFQQNLINLNADLFVVVAFRMMPKALWNMPKHGTINLHASILPDYRGAAPIQRAILNGETLSGLTCFKLQDEIDTGDIVLQKKVYIHDTDNFGTVYQKMKQEGAELLIQSINKIFEPDFKAIPQSSSSLKTAAKITPLDLIIQFDNSTLSIHNQIRAFSPYPAARLIKDNASFKIFKATPILEVHNYSPGDWIIDHANSNLKIACKDGFIAIEEIQADSKKKMHISDFIRGLKKK